MCYSAALYDNTNNLEKAQLNKIERIISKIQEIGDPILEIGCGWGSFMKIASAKNLKIDGITLSKKQYDYINENLISKDKNCKLSVSLKDYRHVSKKYKTIISIEMFEAVGQKYWNSFFKKVHDILADTGQAILQVITIRNDLFAEYSQNIDFIQKMVFPGGILPSKRVFGELVSQNGFKITEQFCFGQDYAKTLQDWHIKFKDKKEYLLSIGYSQKTLKFWELYLSYCYNGFIHNKTDVVQYVIEKNGIAKQT